MRERWVEWIGVLLLAVAALLTALYPPAGRPQDLEVTVQSWEAEPWNGRQQVAVQVTWHWRRQPLLPTGRWQDGIGFNYDTTRWRLTVDGALVDPGFVPARYGLPKPTWTLKVTPGQDGKQTVLFVNQAEKSAVAPAAAFSAQTLFVHVRESDVGLPAQGWVRAVEAVWPYE